MFKRAVMVSLFLSTSAVAALAQEDDPKDENKIVTGARKVDAVVNYPCKQTHKAVKSLINHFKKTPAESKPV